MPKAERDCPFCDYAGPSPILERGKGQLVFAPLRPVTAGHVLVVPEVHARDALDRPVVFGRTAQAAAEYAAAEGIRACNLITSTGRAASQSVGHLHVHVVPRRPGDGLKLPWSGR